MISEESSGGDEDDDQGGFGSRSDNDSEESSSEEEAPPDGKAWFKRPHRPKFRKKDVQPERKKKVAQRVHYLPEGARKKQKIDDKTFHGFIDELDEEKASEQPTEHEVSYLRKFTGVEEKMRSSATNHGLDLQGGNQNGRFPGGDEHQHSVPKVADYKGSRTFQAMKQMSQVANGALLADGEVPVEVETTYASSKDDDALVMSTNNLASQKALRKLLGNPSGLLKRVAKEGDEDESRVAAKLLTHDRQQKVRQERGGENKEDMKKANRAVQLFREGKVVVATSNGNRHAEQNNADAVHDMEENFDDAETAGTKIRCFSCTSEVGPNLKTKKGKFQSGKIYPAQTSPSNLDDTFQQVEDDELVVDKDDPFMPGSQSPSYAYDDYVEEKEKERREAEEAEEAEKKKQAAAAKKTQTKKKS